MKSELIAVIGKLSLSAFIALALSFNLYAASCNKKAEVHQQRAQNLKMQVQMGHIPTTEQEAFVICMLEEKEDKAAFRERAQQLRNQQRAAQERDAAQRRQAALEAARPASPAEQQRHKQICEEINKWPQESENRASFHRYCMSLWAAQPHSLCQPNMVAINLPCGNSCFDPNSNACQNGQIVNKSQSKTTVTQGGLIWMPPTFSRDWAGANAYCQGMSGWRLPIQMEVQNLVRSGAINGQGWFSPGYGEAAWTSTSAEPAIHMTVLFQNGDVTAIRDNYEQRVTCVRVAK